MMCHPVTPPTPIVLIAYPTSLVTIGLHVALIAVLAWLVLGGSGQIELVAVI